MYLHLIWVWRGWNQFWCEHSNVIATNGTGNDLCTTHEFTDWTIDAVWEKRTSFQYGIYKRVSHCSTWSRCRSASSIRIVCTSYLVVCLNLFICSCLARVWAFYLIVRSGLVASPLLQSIIWFIVVRIHIFRLSAAAAAVLCFFLIFVIWYVFDCGYSLSFFLERTDVRTYVTTNCNYVTWYYV